MLKDGLTFWIHKIYQNFCPSICYGFSRLCGVGADLPPPPSPPQVQYGKRYRKVKENLEAKTWKSGYFKGRSNRFPSKAAFEMREKQHLCVHHLTSGCFFPHSLQVCFHLEFGLGGVGHSHLIIFRLWGLKMKN